MYVTKEKEKMSAVSFSSGLYADPKVSRVAGQIMCIVIRFSSHSLLNYCKPEASAILTLFWKDSLPKNESSVTFCSKPVWLAFLY